MRAAAPLIPRWLIVVGAAECAVTLVVLLVALCFPSSRQSVLEITITILLMAWFAARKCNEYVFGRTCAASPDHGDAHAHAHADADADGDGQTGGVSERVSETDARGGDEVGVRGKAARGGPFSQLLRTAPREGRKSK